MKALKSVAKMGLKMSPVGPMMESEIEAEIAAEVSDGFWQKIKDLFAKKKD